MSEPRIEYERRLREMDDAEYVKEAERQIWLSAFAANNPRAPAHWKADAAYDVATALGRPWLYQRAWNAAYTSCGYEVSDEERRKALAPQ